MKKAFIALAMLGLVSGGAKADTVTDVGAAAAAFFKAQNAHDIETISKMLVKSPDVLVIRGPVLAWGHEAAVAQWAAQYKGVWKVAADKSARKVIALNDSTAEVFVPVHFTVGPKEGETKEFTLNVFQLWTRDDGQWLLQTLIATPLPQK